jgi:hypothetical protein
MKRAREFTPPIEEPAGDGLALRVDSARLDTSGAVVARVEAWNGSLLYSDHAKLGAARSRGLFANEAALAYARNASPAPSEAETGRLSAEITQALLQLDAKLRRLLTGEAAGDGSGEPPSAPEALWETARRLAEAPDLLARFDATMRALGLVGEQHNARLVYLAATARRLTEPVNVVVKGPASGGKSHLLKMILTVLPSSAYVDYTSVSPKYLAYADDDLRYRIVVLYEAGGIADGIGAYIMRSLLSEGRLDCGTVDKAEAGGNAARRLVKEGPTALFTSTTRAAVDAELETRLLSIGILDTPGHSRAILAGQARQAAGDAPEPPDLAPWHALQEWLAVAGTRDVRVPFAPALADLVPPQTLRIRRDFPKLLSLVKACALLHQAQRPKAPDGAVLAALDDHAIVRELLAESFAATQQDGLAPAQREAVDAVAALCDERSAYDKGVPQSAVAARLGIDKGSTSRRLANPLAQGYVRDLALKADGKRPRGQQAAYVPGEALPAPITALPEPAAVAAWVPPPAEPEKRQGADNAATLQHSAENPIPEPSSTVAASVAPPDAPATPATAPEHVATPTATPTATRQTRTGTGETAEPLQCCSVADPSDDSAEMLDDAPPAGWERQWI